MFGEFETKISEESNWQLMHVRVYQGLYIAKTENHYKRKTFEKVLKDKLFFDIQEHNIENKKDIALKYFVLEVKSAEEKIYIRSSNRLPLEYLCFHVKN